MIFRILHNRIALVLLPLLLVSALTGIFYRVGRSWFKMSDENGELVRAIHEGAYLGPWLNPIYVLITGGGLMFLIITGITMWRRRDLPGFSAKGTAAGVSSSLPPRRTFRWFHRIVSMVLVLPLAVTALTGMGYRLSQSWLGWTKDDAKWLMDIHQGTLMFGRDYRVYYVLLVGLGLLLLIVTSLKMLRLFKLPKPIKPS